MAKRSRLFPQPPSEAPDVPSAPAAAPAGNQAERKERQYPVAKTREGKRVVTTYVSPEALKQLKGIAIDEEKTVQELLTEGVNAVFAARGLSRIA